MAPGDAHPYLALFYLVGFYCKKIPSLLAVARDALAEHVLQAAFELSNFVWTEVAQDFQEAVGQLALRIVTLAMRSDRYDENLTAQAEVQRHVAVEPAYPPAQLLDRLRNDRGPCAHPGSVRVVVVAMQRLQRCLSHTLDQITHVLCLSHVGELVHAEVGIGVRYRRDRCLVHDRSCLSW